MDYQNGYNVHQLPYQAQPYNSFSGPQVPQAIQASQPLPPHTPQSLQQQQQAALLHQRAALQYGNGPPGGFVQAGGMGGLVGGGSIGGVVGPMMHQQQHQPVVTSLGQQPGIYSSTTSPYAQPIATSAASGPPGLTQFGVAASPPGHISPYAGAHNVLQQQQQQQQQQQAGRPSPLAQHKQQPMAAPPLPQSQAHVPPGLTSPTNKSSAQPPMSPGAQARERERVSLLLEINRLLLQELVNLQTEGKGGSVSQGPPQSREDEGRDMDPNNKPASREFIDCLRRLQANLSYLASSVERNHKPAQPVLPGPAIMDPPNLVSSSTPSLVDMYAKLQALFPGWRGPLAKSSPGPQGAATA